jgi:hypothetical protein
MLLYATLGLGLLRAAIEFSRLATKSGAGFVIFVQVAVFAFMGLLVFMIGRGRNWARIVFLVLFVLGTPLTAKPPIDSLTATPISGVLGIAQIVMQVVAMLLLFRSDGNEWLKKARGPA